MIALGAIGGWLAILAVVFNLVLAQRLDGQAQDVARVRATAAAAAVRLRPDGTPIPLESAGDAALDYGIWVYAGHSAVQRPRARLELQHLADSLAGVGRRGARGDDARLFAIPLRQHGTQVATVVASVSLQAYERIRQTALVGSVVVSVLLLAGAYPVLRLTGRRALQPVEQMARQARDWSFHAPAQRFGSGQRFEELHNLASTLDGVLGRLAAVLRHERQLSAELSHELRTPLSTIVAETDLLLVDRPDDPALLGIRTNAMTMNDIIETLLTTARADLRSDTAACDVMPVAARLVADRTPAFEVRGDPAVAGVDGAIVARLLSPIFDNAARHAQSRVVVEVASADGVVRIDVSNDGASIEAADVERIFEPGVSTGGGAGLGLALARRLARAADGDVVVAASAMGTTFRVTLPVGG